MNDRSKDILDLVNQNGKDATVMTSALKKIGDGDMQKGLDTIARYFENTGINNGISIGERKGWIKGSATTLGITLAIGSGLYLRDRYKKYKEKKELELTGEKIYQAFKETEEQQDNKIDLLEEKDEMVIYKCDSIDESFTDNNDESFDSSYGGKSDD